MRKLPPSWISTYALLGLGRVNLAEGNFEAAQRDLDDAIAIAAQIPSARDGSIEIRPVAVQEQAKQAS